jgi:hypothetical protein
MDPNAERCAGSQFDPSVVGALCVALTHKPSRPRHRSVSGCRA